MRSSVNDSTAVVPMRASSSVKPKFGIFRYSARSLTLPLSQMRGSFSFWKIQSCRVCSTCTWPKSSRCTAFEPSFESSMPMGLAFSKPGISWQPKQPYLEMARSPMRTHLS